MRKFVTESTSDGKRYILPVRDLGEFRHIGWALIGIGLVGVTFMLAWISLPVMAAFNMFAQAPAMAMFMMCFGSLGLMILYPMLKFLMLGAYAILNRTQCIVETDETHVYSIERMGLFSWSRKFELAKIQQLSLEPGMDDSSAGSEHDSRMTIFNQSWLAIKAIGPDDKGFLIAPAYERETIEPLAAELATAIDLQKIALIPQDATDGNPKIPARAPAAVAIPVVDRSTPQAAADYRPDQPAESKIVVHNENDGLVFEVPPIGLIKGCKGILIFSIIWLGLSSLGIPETIFNLLQNPPDFWEQLGSLGLMVAFLAIGVGIFVSAIARAKRSVMIGVMGEQLFIERKTIFGTKWMEFNRDQVQKICIGKSGTEINDEPLMELQIHTADGKKQGLLSQLTNSELQWLASELRIAWSISNEKRIKNWTNAVDQRGSVIAPVETKVQVRHTHPDTNILVPALGISHGLGTIISGIVLAIVSAIGTAAGLIYLDAAIFVGIFGLSMFVSGIAMAAIMTIYVTRRFDIAATPTHLTIIREDCISSKQLDWNAQDIQWIDVQQSGINKNDVEYLQLTITAKSGPGMNLMLGRPTDEIAYVAALLNSQLPIENRNQIAMPANEEESAIAESLV